MPYTIPFAKGIQSPPYPFPEGDKEPITSHLDIGEYLAFQNMTFWEQENLFVTDARIYLHLISQFACNIYFYGIQWYSIANSSATTPQPFIDPKTLRRAMRFPQWNPEESSRILMVMKVLTHFEEHGWPMIVHNK